MWDRRARIARVIDGDTVTAVLDQGFGDTKELTLRLAGVWAPELPTPEGLAAKQVLVDWLAAHTDATRTWPFTVTTLRIRTDAHEVTTLGRYVALVVAADGSNLNDAMSTYLHTPT